MRFIKISYLVLGALCAVLFFDGAANAAACNVPNLIKCLDSACAINIDTAPGARCALCGTDLAADAAKQKSDYKFGGAVPAMQQLALGKTTSVVLTDAQLKSAPTAAGARYAWATGECIKKVSGCTAEDAAKNYDKLIEQSCRAVLTDNEYSATLKAVAKVKSAESCRTDIEMCMSDESICGANFAECDDAEFDRRFAECTINKGCGHLSAEVAENRATGGQIIKDTLAEIKAGVASTRSAYIAAREANIERIAESHRTAREASLSTQRDECAAGKVKEDCIKTWCRVMPRQCGEGFEGEKLYAANLCKFVDLACDKLK